MTSSPIEPHHSDDLDADTRAIPGGDRGVGGPADEAGATGEASSPPGYPEGVDPAEGPWPDGRTPPLVISGTPASIADG